MALETQVSNTSFLSLIVHHFEPSEGIGNSPVYKGEDSIVMDKGEIVDVVFNYKIDEVNPKGKSLIDERSVEITIDMKKTKENDRSNGSANIELLKRWQKTKYVDDNDTKEKFYKVIGIECRFAGERERKIVLYNAYMALQQRIDDNTDNTSYLKITVRQKEDLKSKISISPIDTVYTPSKSTITSGQSAGEDVRYIGAEYYAVFKDQKGDSEVVDVLNYGEQIKIDPNFTESDKFVKVISPSGYVERAKLVMNDPSGTKYNSKLYNEMRLSKQNQNIYAKPYDTSSVIFNVNDKDQIILKGTDSIFSTYEGVQTEWIKCEFNSTEGWIDRKKLGAKVNSNNNMVENLRADNTLGKKETITSVAQKMLDNKFEPAFIAGVIGNILHEGNVGLFEGSNYVTNPSAKKPYLIYMDNYEKYRTLYSGKYIYDGFSLKVVSDLLGKLAVGGWKGGFGLGSIQWTFGRTKTLVNEFYMNNSNDDKITKDQATKSEGEMIVYELNSTHKGVYNNWLKKEIVKNSAASEEAARIAAEIVCYEYEIPADKETKVVARRNSAAEVYRIMKGE